MQASEDAAKCSSSGKHIKKEVSPLTCGSISKTLLDKILSSSVEEIFLLATMDFNVAEGISPVLWKKQNLVLFLTSGVDGCVMQLNKIYGVIGDVQKLHNPVKTNQKKNMKFRNVMYPNYINYFVLNYINCSI